MKRTALETWIQGKIGAEPGAGAALNRSDLEAWQLRKLNETLSLARQRSVFYRKQLAGKRESLDSLQDIQHLPFTTADDLRRIPLQFVCVSQDDIQRVVTLQSSGTTGEPKRIYFTAADQELTIDFFDVGMSVLTEENDRVLILLPGETPGSVGDLLRLGLMRQKRVPLPYGPVRDPLHTLASMQEQQVDCLVGSPTQILGLARRTRPGRHKLRSVLLSTDHVPDAIVKILEETWSCRVFNHYGATETGLGGGVECEAHQGLHMREADLYVEIIDPSTGQPVPEGDYGEVVVSTLTRVGMPLIRYRIGDRSRFLLGGCACGTHLKTMEVVRGRYSGFIRLGEELLRMQDLDEALFCLPDLLNFTVTVSGQVGQENVLVTAHMLNPVDSPARVQQALAALPALQNCAVSVVCQHSPHEPGSLLKRTIIDKRGQHA